MMSLRKYIIYIIPIAIIGAGSLINDKFPAFGPATASADIESDLCEIHGVDVNLCTRCNPELIPMFKAKGDWCAGHNLPESQCDLCNHPYTVDGETVYKKEPDHDRGHDLDHSDDEMLDVTAPEVKTVEMEFTPGISVFYPENERHCETDSAIIQLASIKTVDRVGITLQPVVTAPASPVIEAPAEIIFDEAKSTVLSTTIPALVSQWLVEPGQKVLKGQELARMNSPELPRLKADYLEAFAARLLAEKKVNRQTELHDKELSSDSEFEEVQTQFMVADAHFVGARGVLKSAGLSDNDLENILENKEINQTLIIRAPKDGIVVERKAVLGELLAEGEALAIIADPNSLWIEANVSEYDADRIQLGSRMEFSSDGGNLRKSVGEVIWVAQYLDPVTRTATVRARLTTDAKNLRCGEFGWAQIQTDNLLPQIMIPRDAIQWEGCCNIVFVKEAIDRYRPRKVKIEPGNSEYYFASSGLRGDEEVVVEGSFLLKTELLKAQIGAGCAGCVGQ